MKEIGGGFIMEKEQVKLIETMLMAMLRNRTRMFQI